MSTDILDTLKRQCNSDESELLKSLFEKRTNLEVDKGPLNESNMCGQFIVKVVGSNLIRKRPEKIQTSLAEAHNVTNDDFLLYLYVFVYWNIVGMKLNHVQIKP